MVSNHTLNPFYKLIDPVFVQMLQMFVFRHRHIAIDNWNYKQAQQKDSHNIDGSHNTKFTQQFTFHQNKSGKPEAVVKLVIKVALPTFVITRCNDFAWFPCCFISC